MEISESSDVDVLGMMFGAGALSAAHDAGMAEKDAEAFVEHVCKEAASYSELSDYDDTWWNRNKGWALPVGIGLGAFLLGSNAARESRTDRGHFMNAANYLLSSIRKLLGYSDDPLNKTITEADPEVLETNMLARRIQGDAKKKSFSSGIKIDPKEAIDPDNKYELRHARTHGIIGSKDDLKGK